MAKKIVLTGGGTAGHCYPNLALVPLLRESGYDITYIGSYDGIERSLVEAYGRMSENCDSKIDDHNTTWSSKKSHQDVGRSADIERVFEQSDGEISYFGIATGKLRRYFDLKNFTDPFRVVKGFFEARHILKVVSPDIVFSKGGFVAVPVVKAAASLGIPVVIHESDMTPGLANKLSYSSAGRICCSFRNTVSMLPEGKGIFTGSPIRASLLEGDAARARQFLGMREGDYPFLMVIGGSQGAQHVNEAVRAALPELVGRFNVIHLCGRGKTDPSLNRMDGYMQYEYISEELADLYALADIVVSRAGSNAIFELLALHKPNLLIPLGTGGSRGDQILNAEDFAKNGYSKILLEEDMTTASLLSAINEVYENRQSYADAMSKASENNAVSNIVNVIKDICEKGDKQHGR